MALHERTQKHTPIQTRKHEHTHLLLQVHVALLQLCDVRLLVFVCTLHVGIIKHVVLLIRVEVLVLPNQACIGAVQVDACLGAQLDGLLVHAPEALLPHAPRAGEGAGRDVVEAALGRGH